MSESHIAPKGRVDNMKMHKTDNTINQPNNHRQYASHPQLQRYED